MMNDDQRKLAEDNINLCYFMSNKYMRKYGEAYFTRIGMAFDDLVSVGYDALCKTAIIFDPSKGAFATIYAWAFYGEIRKAVKNAYSRRGRVLTESVSYDIPINGEGDTYTDIIGGVLDQPSDRAIKEMQCEIEDAALRVLNPRDAHVLKLYCDKKLRQHEIAKIVGTTQGHVSRIIRKSRKCLGEELEKLGYACWRG